MFTTFHYTEKDSTKNKPHYVISFFDKKTNDFIGQYKIQGFYLYDVFIDSKQRGKGYCKHLVAHAVKRKKNLVLDVIPSNIAGIKCYKKCGFKFVKELKDYHHPSWGKNIKPVDVLRFKHYG